MEEQKNRYYAGIELEKDLNFCAYMEELKANPFVKIIRNSDECVVHEMKYANGWNYDRVDTGETHMGYTDHYVTFEYRGFIFYVQPGTYYPFVDDNYPGAFNFILYRKIDHVHMAQCTYYEEYLGLKSIDNYLEKHHIFNMVRGATEKTIDWGTNGEDVIKIAKVVRDKGGYREKSIFENQSLILESERTKDHHVFTIYGQPEADGHRDTFDVDTVTMSICG